VAGDLGRTRDVSRARARTALGAVLTGKGEEFTPEEICAGRERDRERQEK